MRSILANTLEPESFQINQNHNKDLDQHWPGEFSALCMNVSLFFVSKNLCSLWEYLFLRKHLEHLWSILQEILFLNFIPDINIEEKFYSSRSVGFFQNTQILLWKIFLKYFPAKISSPTEQWGEKFYSDNKGSIISNYTKKHWD